MGKKSWYSGTSTAQEPAVKKQKNTAYFTVSKNCIFFAKHKNRCYQGPMLPGHEISKSTFVVTRARCYQGTPPLVTQKIWQSDF